MRQLAEAMGLTCVRAFKMDATRALLPPEQPPPEQQQGGEPGSKGSAAAAAAAAAAAPSAAEAGPGTTGRRGGATQPVSAAMLRRLERIAAARRARGLEAPPSAHVAAGKEAVLRGFPPASFDFVLCDAPCTALGLRPRLVHRQTLRDLQQTAVYQRRLLSVAAALLRPGGHLVFSTCSINPGAA